jgi:hypothetical protein
MRARAVTREGILVHEQREAITDHDGNWLAMQGCITLDLVGQRDVYTGHEGYVFFGFGAATRTACRLSHRVLLSG